MNEVVRELSRVLISCFSEEISTDLESKLHEESYVDRKLKKHLGSKGFKEYDKYGEQVWREAWREFDQVLRIKNN